MYEAYNEGKDLYAMIAQSAFNNDYAANLEFFPEGTELEIDGKKIVSGSGKELMLKTDENDSITVKYYELLETPGGELSASELNIGDTLVSDIGKLTIINKKQDGNKVTFKLSV